MADIGGWPRPAKGSPGEHHGVECEHRGREWTHGAVRGPSAGQTPCAFDDKHALGFPLLPGRDHDVADQYGTWGEYVYQGERSSFLIAEDGRIERVWSPVKAEGTVPLGPEALGGGVDTCSASS
jgi:hypothetical protein